MGGLAFLLKQNPKVTIYAPKEGFGVYGADLPSTFFRKDASLPAHQRYYNGNPPEIMRFGAAWPGARINLVDKNTEIAPAIHLLSFVSDKPGTLELRELSLALNTPDGMVVIVGCSHPGVEKIVQSAAVINPRIHLVAGGFHLVVAKDEEIDRVVSALRDTSKVSYVAPGHCTGEPTFKALQKSFGNRYLYAGIGAILDQATLSTTPTANSDISSALLVMDRKDRESYRALLARSDDNEHGAVGHLGHHH
jgi:7,8-dihydropterin-6-yl-methyl-4-(beta-D-ribofuranosyl)aminobenzene 5'-phosphate synthase